MEKFETNEDLKAHEAKKPYGCQYCGNRFKNKNEAERHENSIHIQRFSWSCGALKDHCQAFYESAGWPNEADTCGYCGKEFGRSSRRPANNRPRSIGTRDRGERSRHLQDAHKFGECDTSKKFFRIEHFIQHLKHSHASTNGKWVDMLETVCKTIEKPKI
uniref:C2H2-type domain-containing protein n=1 Tax=Bionectria ochroleuca TaxID=29856 RepID=A0A0B7KMT2_BIOOC